MATDKKVFHLRPDLEKTVIVSRAVQLGNLLFLSGTKSLDESGTVVGAGDFDAQIAHVYAEIDKTLKAHGASAENVLKETIYTRDIEASFSANVIRERFYEGVPAPASTVVEVSRLIFPDLLVEIDIIAEVPRNPNIEDPGPA